MSFHSEEIWESVDMLWRRVQSLNRLVSELETRVEVLERLQDPACAGGIESLNSVYEGEVHK